MAYWDWISMACSIDLAPISCSKARVEILERLLRIVGNLCGDGLEALIHLAERTDGRIKAIFAYFLELFETFEHG